MTGGYIDASVYGIVGNGSLDGTTITITGGTIECDGNAIYHPQEGDITINGGEISGLTGLWYSGTGKITISGGTIKSIDTTDRTDPYKPADQNDGTSYDGAALSIVSRGDDYQDDGKSIVVEITGGTLESFANQAIRDYRFAKVDGTWQTNASSGVEKNYLSGLEISGDAKVIAGEGKDVFDADPMSVQNETYAISGGSFSSDVSDYCVDGFIPTVDEEGNFVVDVDEGVLDIDIEEILGFSTGEAGQTYKIEAVSDLDVTWKSDTPEVATVDQYGNVTFVSEGDARIEATVTLGNGQTMSKYVSVTVMEVSSTEGVTFEAMTDADLEELSGIIANPDMIPDDWSAAGESGALFS